MGGRARVVVYAPSHAAATNAARDAFAVIEAAEDALSDYRVAGELSRLHRTPAGQPFAASASLRDATTAALRVAQLTSGAYDPTVGPIVALWREARRTGTLPTDDAVDAARRLVDYRAIRVEDQSITIDRPGVRLDFGGIGKGFAADAASARLSALGMPSHLVALEGDIRVAASPPGEPGWHIEIVAPPAEPHPTNAHTPKALWLRDAAISTSGDASQFVEIAGVRYSHIADPLTGQALTRSTQATVVARSATDADSFATALCVMGDGPDSRRVAVAARLAHAITSAAAAEAPETFVSPRLVHARRHKAEPLITGDDLAADFTGPDEGTIRFEFDGSPLVGPRHAAGWTDRAGRYAVVVEYAAGPTEGGTFRIEVNGLSVNGRALRSPLDDGNPKDVIEEAAVLELPCAGRLDLTIVPLSPAPIMRLRSTRLVSLSR